MKKKWERERAFNAFLIAKHLMLLGVILISLHVASLFLLTDIHVALRYIGKIALPLSLTILPT